MTDKSSENLEKAQAAEKSRTKDQARAVGNTARALRQAQPYIDASWQLIGSVALGCLGGWWLDGKLGTQPWLLVAGAAFGLVAGMISFLRIVSKLAAKQQPSTFEFRNLEEPPFEADSSKGEAERSGRWDDEGWDLSQPARGKLRRREKDDPEGEEPSDP